MCGIAGKLGTRGAVDPDVLHRMQAVIEHRGPDSGGEYVEGGVGLAIRRLAVIDLDAGDQPIFNEDRSVVVVMNGEIYNYRELREDLLARGHTFRTQSDTETIVHLYEDHGDDCVDFLRGMFAFALWDTRKRRLLIARDRVGKKPLFYRATADTLWFGSEVRSLLQDPDVPRTPDPAAIDAYLRLGYVPHPLSAFGGVQKLPPGHVLTWHDGQTELRRYWKLNYEPTDDRPAAELEERVRELIREATRLRLRSDVPLGAFLSGGIDSAAVVAAMALESSQPVQTFSIGFDVEAYDETAHARTVAERYGTEHHELRVESDSTALLPKLAWIYGEPFADASALPTLQLSELTRRHVTVALNGDGGDEAFAGYQRYPTQVLAARAGRLPKPLLRAAARLASGARRGGSPSSRGARIERLASTLPLSEVDRYRQWMSVFDEHDLDELYTPEFASQLDGGARARPIRDAWDAADARDLPDRLLAVDVETYLPGDLLVKVDLASMAHSLEVRSPLLDHVLLEEVARMPAALKLHGRRTKHLFKEAVRPWVPDAIIDRPKKGFEVPVSAWLRGPLADLPGDTLLDPASVERGWLRPDVVARVVEEHRSGARDHGNRLWALIQLELWARTFVDQAVPAPVTLSVA